MNRWAISGRWLRGLELARRNAHCYTPVALILFKNDLTMGVRTKYFLHKHYSWLIGIVVLMVTVLSIILYFRGDDWKVLLTVIGGSVSLIYVIEKQQLDEAKLFKELFVEFNRRYDDLNEELNRMAREDPTAPLTSANLDCLFDYFNLCGEEFLFYRKGYIYPEVWQSLGNGHEDFL